MEVRLGENDRLDFVLKKFRRQMAKAACSRIWRRNASMRARPLNGDGRTRPRFAARRKAHVAGNSF